MGLLQQRMISKRAPGMQDWSIGCYMWIWHCWTYMQYIYNDTFLEKAPGLLGPARHATNRLLTLALVATTGGLAASTCASTEAAVDATLRCVSVPGTILAGCSSGGSTKGLCAGASS